MAKTQPRFIQHPTLWTWRRQILQSSLPPETRHVLLTLSCYMRDADMQCYAAPKAIAADTGLTAHQVEQALQRASIEGWVDVVAIEDNHLQVTRVYRP